MAHYIENDTFLSLMIRYKNNPTQKDYEKIGKFFLLITQRLMMKPCFINYSQDRKNEMQSDALYYMCKYMHNYDYTRSNPFAYFTQYAWSAFVQQIKKNKANAERTTNIDFIENIHTFDSFDMKKDCKDIEKIKEKIIDETIKGLEKSRE